MNRFHQSRISPPLGPDPEPYGERFARLLASDTRGRVMSAPPLCPLERAFGREVPCGAEGCPYYRVPEVPTECAIDHWAPSVSRHPVLAQWFLERRRSDCQ